VWPEAVGEGRLEWRGRAQHPVSGEQLYFHEWDTLIAFLTKDGPPGAPGPAQDAHKPGPDSPAAQA
jgi:hypothetical protein